MYKIKYHKSNNKAGKIIYLCKVKKKNIKKHISKFSTNH